MGDHTRWVGEIAKHIITTGHKNFVLLYLSLSLSFFVTLNHMNKAHNRT